MSLEDSPLETMSLETMSLETMSLEDASHATGRGELLMHRLNSSPEQKEKRWG